MWYALHGFIHDFKALDDYLQKSFPYVIQKDLKQFFFIRYWLGGPHIRLRFKADEHDYPIIKERFRSSIDTYLQNHDVELIDYSDYYQPTMLENENINKTYWCQHGSVEEFTYQPEYERYGGRDKMEKSEDVFSQSSQMALILNKLSFPKRILVALDLIYLTLREVDGSRDIYRFYADMWENYSDDGPSIDFENKNVFKKRIDMLKKAEPHHFKLYYDYFDSLKQNGVIDDVRLLVSHVHMTNNRLGVTPVLEYKLAACVSEHV